MSKTNVEREKRSEKIVEYLKKNPIVTDKQLSEEFGVSINTIRLDRARLGIKEFKERLMEKANRQNITAITKSDIVGEVVKFVSGKKAVSKLKTKPYMVFENSKVVQGQYIYALAETLAISLIPMKAALVGVANIKYFSKITMGQVIYAHAEVMKKIAQGFVVWVRILDEKQELKFKGKFILKGIE